MLPEEHSRIPLECQQARTQEIAEICDNEYYISASPPNMDRERAARGRDRIVQGITELQKLLSSVKCAPCQYEIRKQITLQSKGLNEIELTWDL